MEMVSASKMRRSQVRVVSSRPYARKIADVVGDLAHLQNEMADPAAYPLLEQREVRRVELILITPDKGLTGPLVSNLLRRATRFILEEAGAPVSVIAVGKKGRDFMIRTKQDVVAEFTGLSDTAGIDEIRPILQVAMDDYSSGRVDAVYMLYARFVNTLTQVPNVDQIMPITAPRGSGGIQDFIFEPSADEVLAGLLPRYIETQLFQAVLEGFASEHSARMVAMRNASENAKDLVSELTLSYNKARQSQITREVSEIAAGANALKQK